MKAKNPEFSKDIIFRTLEELAHLKTLDIGVISYFNNEDEPLTLAEVEKSLLISGQVRDASDSSRGGNIWGADGRADFS